MTQSSAKANHYAMALVTCELIWLKQLIQELKLYEPELIEFVHDNNIALHITSNPIFHERTKHIEIDCHFIKEKVVTEAINTIFVKSNDQLAICSQNPSKVQE